VHTIARAGIARLKSYIQPRITRPLMERTKYRAFAGSPETSITSYASKHECDLIVVGAHDRHGLEYFLGTTASAVLYRADCDVIGIRDRNINEPYKSVVVAVDGGDQTRSILDKAATIANKHKRRTIVTVIRPLALDYQFENLGWETDKLTDLTSDLERSLVLQIENQVSSSRLSDLEVHTRRGKPSTELKAFAKEQKADLIVMGSGSRHGPGWMIGSTTHNLLHGVSCDVLVIRQSKPRTEQ
ncbi:MAG: universal stress protein A, partial [Candidatus Azotimanducaceae bacterium]